MPKRRFFWSLKLSSIVNLFPYRATISAPVTVAIEVRPVEGGNDFDPIADDVRNPAPEELPDVNAAVAEQPVHLFDGVLALEPRRQRQSSTDRVNAQGRSVQHAHRGVREGGHPLGMQVVSENRGDEFVDADAVEGMCVHGTAA